MKDDFALLILLPPRHTCRDCRCAPPQSEQVQIQSMLAKHSTRSSISSFPFYCSGTYVAQVGFELPIPPWLALNSWSSSLYLPNTGIASSCWTQQHHPFVAVIVTMLTTQSCISDGSAIVMNLSARMPQWWQETMSSTLVLSQLVTNLKW